MVILITENNGETLSILVPADGYSVDFCKKDIPIGAMYKVVNKNSIPKDRTFRNAWEVEINSTWEEMR